MDFFYSFVFESNDSLHLYKSDRLTCTFLQVMMHSKLEHRAILDVRSNIHPISTKVLKVWLRVFLRVQVFQKFKTFLNRIYGAYLVPYQERKQESDIFLLC